MGAWIEMAIYDYETVTDPQSHPSWVRGLKCCAKGPLYQRTAESHPSWVRGLKLQY